MLSCVLLENTQHKFVVYNLLPMRVSEAVHELWFVLSVFLMAAVILFVLIWGRHLCINFIGMFSSINLIVCVFSDLIFKNY